MIRSGSGLFSPSNYDTLMTYTLEASEYTGIQNKGVENVV